jgi:hypothetical protein
MYEEIKMKYSPFKEDRLYDWHPKWLMWYPDGV